MAAPYRPDTEDALERLFGRRNEAAYRFARRNWTEQETSDTLALAEDFIGGFYEYVLPGEMKARRVGDVEDYMLQSRCKSVAFSAGLMPTAKWGFANRYFLSLLFTHMTRTTCDEAARWVGKVPPLSRRARWFMLGTYLLMGTLVVSVVTRNPVGICLSVVAVCHLLTEMVNLRAEVYARLGMAEKHLDICFSPACAL